MGRIRGKALKGINEEALDVSMDGGSICGVTPPNAFRVKRIMNSRQYFLIKGKKGKFIIIVRCNLF